MIAWLVETFVAVTLLMVAVLALRGPVARSFGAGWAYALWAVPALRLVVPPLPQLTPDLSFPSAVIIPTAAEMAAPLPADAGPGQWVPLLLALWAGGAVIFLTLQWLSYRAFRARVAANARPARPPLFGGIRTWISEAVEGPLAVGVIDRRIVLPTDFSRRYSPSERRLALEHELVHHKRGDIWWNLAALVLLALFWFNPVAWAAFRAFRIDQELACDAAVARSVSTDERHDYARALVKSAVSPALIAACALNPADQLKRRLRMMGSHRASVGRSAGGLFALSLLSLTGLALGTAPQALEVAAPQFVSAAVPSARLAAVTGHVPTSAPVRQAAAYVEEEIVVTGRRPKAAVAKSVTAAAAPDSAMASRAAFSSPGHGSEAHSATPSLFDHAARAEALILDRDQLRQLLAHQRIQVVRLRMKPVFPGQAIAVREAERIRHSDRMNVAIAEAIARSIRERQLHEAQQWTVTIKESRGGGVESAVQTIHEGEKDR
ncbi:MAG TPA: M56 family metallopeptidase [Allosphingosinicella sp.]|jgi:beta-lactamase regulating signal transducer with metallopeptidase domain